MEFVFGIAIVLVIIGMVALAAERVISEQKKKRNREVLEALKNISADQFDRLTKIQIQLENLRNENEAIQVIYKGI